MTSSTNSTRPRILIVGAGLVGCLFALRLQETNLFDVLVYEKRSDSRKQDKSQSVGKSINLALSKRGLTALGEDLTKKLHNIGVKMPRRIIHRQDKSVHYQNYGRNRDEYLLSVSRRELNELLMDEAEEAGVKFFFGYKCMGCDLVKGSVRFTTDTYDKDDAHLETVRDLALIVGADGAFSAIRQQLSKFGRFNMTQKYISHGYSELTIPPTKDGRYALEDSLKGDREDTDPQLVQGLHIWSRKDFMLIALPNHDKSYTVTLFFRFESKSKDKPGYDQLKTDKQIDEFFREQFPDAYDAIPDVVADFKSWPASGLVTVKCEPHYGGKALLIGDSAHPIVPFFGQGVNAGFEDVTKFFEIFNSEKTSEANPEARLNRTIPIYSKSRKRDVDTISDLAVEHFEDMKRNTTSQDYFKKKHYESDLQAMIPNGGFIPLYSMVTFSNRSYYESLQKSKLQQRFIEEILAQHPMKFERVYGDENSMYKEENADERAFLIQCYEEKLQEKERLLH
mmetsp:Transcript_4842/g.18102  ORF Transcript_4842/g.18102 Transcript_4842/m.18102 type:complete len:508 (-) Transcript_4842:104-1627(-)